MKASWDLVGKPNLFCYSYQEDAFLKLKKQFLDEWTVVKNVDREILEGNLEKALETSVEKISKSS
jgi:hypothetical protein